MSLGSPIGGVVGIPIGIPIARIHPRTGGGGPVRPSAPFFTEQPQSASLYEGDNLLLTATSVGTLPITHQWQFRPFYTGDPYQGQTLTSAEAGQWYINDVAVSGETGDTFVVPETVLLGDKI